MFKTSYVKPIAISTFLLIAVLCLLQDYKATAKNVDASKPKNYHYERERILITDSTSQNGWQIDDTAGNYSAKKNQYTLIVENKDSNSRAWLSHIALDPAKDFEMEVVVSFTVSVETERWSKLFLVWGLDRSAGSKGIMQLGEKGRVNFGECKGGEHIGCKKSYAHIYKYKSMSPHLFTIRKVKEKYYLFVNGKLEENVTIPVAPKGDFIGFGAGEFSFATFSNFKLSYFAD